MSFSSGLQRSSSTNATCDECSSPRSEWNEEFDRGLTQLMHDNLYWLDMPECFKHSHNLDSMLMSNQDANDHQPILHILSNSFRQQNASLR